jgi:lipoprotein-anchoring transpeptidase ErfK/SrfK
MDRAAGSRPARRPPGRRAAVALLAVAAVALGACSSSAGSTSARRPLAAAPAQAAQTEATKPLDVPTTTTRPPAGPVRYGSGPVAAWAKRTVALFAAPGGGRRTGTYPARTPWGGPSVFLVKRALRHQDGAVWLQVLVPRRPNGGRAWARGSDFVVAPLRTRITVDLSERRLTLLRDERPVRSVTVAVGSAVTPTPVGEFFITVKLRPPVISRVYGAWALGLSGYSDVLEQFGTGDGQIALHGTRGTWALGQAVSNGCVRMTDADVSALAKAAPPGTPVTIVA